MASGLERFPALVLVLLAWLPRTAASETCVDVYTAAFKGRKSVKPTDVGELYFTYCKKNMRVSSAKSMDELCKPLVRKVEDKMLWVPPDMDVTPDMVCKSADALKKDFPQHAAAAQAGADARFKEANAEKEEREALAKSAKLLSAKFNEEVHRILTESGEGLRDKLLTRAREVLGTSSLDEHDVKLVSSITEAMVLGLRGLETKVSQKKDEALKVWVNAEAKRRLVAKSSLGAGRKEL